MEALVEALEIEPQPPLEIAPAARKPRILVVEDDQDMRRLVAYMLEKEGYEVIQAASGVGLLAGIELTTWSGETDSYDAIVSDIQMPDLTALDVLGGLPDRSLGIPVVLMTAYGSAENRARAHALGVLAFLDKPLDWDKLRIAVRKAVSVE